MTEDIFASSEIQWLNKNPKVHESIMESLEDSLNVDTLDTGEHDLTPYKRAIISARITIEITQKKMIEGPYNKTHLQLIFNHLKKFTPVIQKEKIFWELFSFHCACAEEEDEGRSKKRIYMEGLKEVIRMIEDGSLEMIESGNDVVVNLNTNTRQQIKGKGVNAKFSD